MLGVLASVKNFLVDSSVRFLKRNLPKKNFCDFFFIPNRIYQEETTNQNLLPFPETRVYKDVYLESTRNFDETIDFFSGKCENMNVSSNIQSFQTHQWLPLSFQNHPWIPLSFQAYQWLPLHVISSKKNIQTELMYIDCLLIFFLFFAFFKLVSKKMCL